MAPINFNPMETIKMSYGHKKVRVKQAIYMACCLFGFSSVGEATNLTILTCEPEWAALAQELAGEKATITSATTGLQDPHRIQVRPSLLAKARQADLLICTGAELEIGWLPLLIRDAGNRRIQEGQLGYFEASRFVSLLDKPQRLDRAEGDVHAQGNPHIHLNPHAISKIAVALQQRLIDLDPTNTYYYQSRGHQFQQRWQQAIQKWEQAALPLKGTPIVVQHQAYPYLNQWLGLTQIATLEPKPGLEPSTPYLNQVLQQIKTKPPAMIIRSAYHSPRASQWLASQTHIPVVTLPFTVGGSEKATNLFTLFDETIAQLKAGADKTARRP